jgi:hypothetical protein
MVVSAQASSKKFLDTLEEVLLSGGTSPVVRERLLDVLAAAAFTHPGNGKEGYRVLWKKVKPPHKPDEVCISSYSMIYLIIKYLTGDTL